MAFHTSCPITLRRICDCALGFPSPLRLPAFLADVHKLSDFLQSPWSLKPPHTIHVAVPKLTPTPAVDDDAAEAAAKAAADDYVRRLAAVGAAGEEKREDRERESAGKVTCRICFCGESEGSERAGMMMACKFCSNKYHRGCLNNWAEHRDLFNWNSWACPSCRLCEVCRRAGDPNRLMYCKRCDGAYHCYCQQPPHKNVGHGPYLCPKHTRCHSCGSNVPGSGLSTRWFLGYTCCDACGRLFTKGNYCPVCLKVYRDSETTPMVCCDVCHKWVHCVCDGISEEKYQQFQADQNLYYKCATCRGNCYKVRDLDDAVRELWKRKDEDDRDLIATLRVSAGLPPQDMLSVSPYSDDAENGHSGRPLKFSLKGLNDKSAKNGKEAKHLSPSTKNSKKKGYHIKFIHKSDESYQNVERQHEARSLESSFGDDKFGVRESYTADVPEIFSSSRIRSSCKREVNAFVSQPGSKSGNFVKEAVVKNADRHNKVNKLHGVHIKESAGKVARKSESNKGTKLVIHLGAKNTNGSISPRSETSSCHREQDISASYGGDGNSKSKTKKRKIDVLEAHVGISKQDEGRGARFDDVMQSNNSKHAHREKNIIKLGKVSDTHRKRNGNLADEYELPAICESPPLKRKRNTDTDSTTGTVAEGTLRNDKFVLKKQLAETSHTKSISNTASDPRPLLKLKFKNRYFDQKSSWAPRGEEENVVKGQRSKRKRPSAEKMGIPESGSFGQLHQETQGDEAMEAKILLKLGKGAVGKRIEVHQSSDNSWHPGVVSGTIEGSSSLTVRLDDGGTTTLELGKQGVRFVEKKKQKKSHT